MKENTNYLLVSKSTFEEKDIENRIKEEGFYIIDKPNLIHMQQDLITSLQQKHLYEKHLSMERVMLKGDYILEGGLFKATAVVPVTKDYLVDFEKFIDG